MSTRDRLRLAAVIATLLLLLLILNGCASTTTHYIEPVIPQPPAKLLLPLETPKAIVQGNELEGIVDNNRLLVDYLHMLNAWQVWYKAVNPR